MRAHWQTEPVAYLAGALVSDGWLSTPRRQRYGCLGLRVADRDFAEAFATAIRTGYGCTAKVVTEKRGYFVVRRYSGGRFEHLVGYEPTTMNEQAAWLCGFFDGDGCATAVRVSKRPNSCSRRVAIYNTNRRYLERAETYLAVFGLETRWNTRKPTVGHLGTKPVFELALCSSRESYERFKNEIGSSIGRKRAKLRAIVDSYCDDLAAARRGGQAQGAATKRKRRDERLPSVLSAIRDLVAMGIRPTARRMATEIPGYHGAQSMYRASQLVDMACAQ